MTPEQIKIIREFLAEHPMQERPILVRRELRHAAAEFLRLHDALERLYEMTGSDIQCEADSLGVCPATLADTVEQIVRRFVQ